VFVRNHQTGTTERVSHGTSGVQGNHYSEAPALTSDGRFVAFASLASNLVPDDTNGQTDVFVRDHRTGVTERFSLGPNRVQGNNGSSDPALSAGGRFVAFASGASNLVPGDTNGERDVFVRDRQTGTTARVSLGPNGSQAESPDEDAVGSLNPVLSSDGRFVAFESSANNLVPGDTNNADDVFVRTLAGE